MREQETVRIPYDEYRAIGEIFRAHLTAHEKQLRAVVAFGPLVTQGGTLDIDLLEIVDGWKEPSAVTFRSTAALPLRGLLRLYIFSTQDFEQPSRIRDAETRLLRNDIFARVQQGYEVIYENPLGSVAKVLAQTTEAAENVSPLTFLDSLVTAKEAA